MNATVPVMDSLSNLAVTCIGDGRGICMTAGVDGDGIHHHANVIGEVTTWELAGCYAMLLDSLRMMIASSDTETQDAVREQLESMEQQRAEDQDASEQG